jgi:4-hydroxy-tetrahydrodipicolinate synthase
MYGVIAAVPTPVDTMGIPQKDLFLSHCSWALENGCDGLNILGSTGEANSFGSEARKTIMGWAAENLDRSKLMVGTGTPSLRESVELTKHADTLGFGVALVLPPYYYKPVSEDGLFSWYARLHEALSDAKIEVYFYNFPNMTGLIIPVSVIERLHSKWPKRFRGIKDSSGDLDYCRALTSAMPDLAVFPSSEVTLGEAVKSGFAGCISATTNQTGPLCAKIWAEKNSPNPALLDQVSELRQSISATSLIPAIKYLVAQRIGNPEFEHLVPPFCELSEDQKKELAPVVTQLAYDQVMVS